MPAGYVPSFSWPKLGIYGIYGTQRIMGKEWDITTRIHVHIYIHCIYIWCYDVLWSSHFTANVTTMAMQMASVDG